MIDCNIRSEYKLRQEKLSEITNRQIAADMVKSFKIERRKFIGNSIKVFVSCIVFYFFVLIKMFESNKKQEFI